MADSPDKLPLKEAPPNTAVFKKRKVYGIDRYYPENELAQNLVNFKLVTTQQNKKRFIKCLAQREIEAAELLGISMILE